MTNQDSCVWSTVHQSSANFPDDAEATLIPGMGREGMNWNHIDFPDQGRQKKSVNPQKKSLKISQLFGSNPSFKDQQRSKISSHANVTDLGMLRQLRSKLGGQKRALGAKKTPRFLAENHGAYFFRKKNWLFLLKDHKSSGSHDIFRFTKFFGGNCLCCSNFGAFFSAFYQPRIPPSEVFFLKQISDFFPSRTQDAS